MLVLSRQRDEVIMIGDSIRITVVDIRGDKIRIGVDAPTNIPVHRKEVYDNLKREGEEAARQQGAGIDTKVEGDRPYSPPGQPSVPYDDSEERNGAYKK